MVPENEIVAEVNDRGLRDGKYHSQVEVIEHAREEEFWLDLF